MKILLYFIFILSTCAIQAQVFSGSIKDKSTAGPLAYANIGIVGKNVGTVSSENGSFSIRLDSIHDNDNIRFSLLGYKPLEMKVSVFRKAYANRSIISLEENIEALKEVIIRTDLQSAEWGNVPGKDHVTAGFVNNVLGNEMGIVIKSRKRPAYIEAFHAIVAFNKYETLKFRLNFYDMKKGLPNNPLVSESIIVTSSVEKGVLDVDLSEYYITANGDFFVSLEWIEGLGEGGLHFMADYSGPQLITRAASQGKWNKQDDLSFCFTVIVKY